MCRLSVFFCIVVLFSVAFAQDACNRTPKGQFDGTPYTFQPAELTPGIRDWDVDIPKPPGCDQIIGVVSTACDYDTEPSQYIEGLDPGTVHIHRNGNLLESGTVRLTVYCLP